MTTYNQLSYTKIIDILSKWKDEYPNLIKIYNAQDTFGIPSPGTCASFLPCKQYYFRITNENTLPDIYRPEVFFSGALHGNERVGPTAVVEFARILLENYNEPDVKKQSTWLKKLVDTRSIYIMPSANAIGYYKNTREENGIDPNRDFPYNQDPDKCMKTTAARAVNELWREHIFQLSLTFHAGEISLDYEWGAYNHPPPNDQSPDERGFKQLAETSSKFANRFGNVKQYPTARLGRDPYDVNGGMEDWAYAASWETEYIKPCQPSKNHFNGYDISKTIYNNVSNRAMNFLVETSNNKDPSSTLYGTKESVFNPSDRINNGHCSRNIRLAMMMTEMVQPYIHIINEPMLIAKSNGNNPTNDLELLQHTYEWDVGGAFMVDQTDLIWSYWPKDKFNGKSCHCYTENHEKLHGQRPGYGLDHSKLKFNIANSFKNSPTRWINQPDYKIKNRFLKQFNGGKLPLGTDITLNDGQELVVFIRAKVDSTWGHEKISNAFPKVNPQSHVVQNRINRSWYGKSDDGCHGIQGCEWGYSVPICISNDGGGGGGGGIDSDEKFACNAFLNDFQASQNRIQLKCPDQLSNNINNQHIIFGIDQGLFIFLVIVFGLLSLAFALYCKYFRRYGLLKSCIRNRKLDSYMKSTTNDGYFDDVHVNNGDRTMMVIESYEDQHIDVNDVIVSDEEDGVDGGDGGIEMTEK